MLPLQVGLGKKEPKKKKLFMVTDIKNKNLSTSGC